MKAWRIDKTGPVYGYVDSTDLSLSKRGRPFLGSPKATVVHVAVPDSFPFVPLCGAVHTGDEDSMHFVVNLNQVYTHPRICPACAGHEDIPMMLLGDV